MIKWLLFTLHPCWRAKRVLLERDDNSKRRCVADGVPHCRLWIVPAVAVFAIPSFCPSACPRFRSALLVKVSDWNVACSLVSKVRDKERPVVHNP